MNVAAVMTARPVTVTTNASVAAALAAMEDLGCHHLPVLSADKHLVGVVSYLDCQQALGMPARRHSAISNEQLAASITVAHVMTPAPIIVEPDAPAAEAARLMIEHYVGCLPVMRGESLVGIVTRSDLLMAFMALSEQPVPGHDIPRRGS